MIRELTHAAFALARVLMGAALLASASAQDFNSLPIFTHLQSLVFRLPVGDPALSGSDDGPKGIALADFNGDGTNDLAVSNTDGTVTVWFGQGNGRFGQVLHLLADANASLRGIVAADFNGDARPDLATAAPGQDRVYLFFNESSPGMFRFAAPANILAWHGARNLAAGDFDGNGGRHLIVAGPNNGLRQYRGSPNGSLTQVANVFEVNFPSMDRERFPKPLYSMRTFRPVGVSRDYLAVTHADTNVVWILTPGSSGALGVGSSVTNGAPAHGLAIGPLRSLASSGVNDLVTVQRDAGWLEIHAGTNTPTGFSFVQADERQRLYVPGGPRAVEIADLNQDGWNDLVVVVRNFDTVVTYANSNGVLRLVTERPVGSSPREMVTGYLDGDNRPDLAVMNRGSADVSILLAHQTQAGYRGVNHAYLVDGNVVGLVVTNVNGDANDDVIQLHRASGDFSVRLANPDGTLQPPVFYTVGNVPAAQVFLDVNNDHVLDQVAANLGTARIESGYVSVRLGLTNTPSGFAFGSERQYFLSNANEVAEGRLFALVPADFDRDGNIDLTAGFLDSRTAFFRGQPDGSFQFERAIPVPSEARGLVAGDFDGDSDLDLAGVGASGTIWVMENPGGPANSQTNLLMSVAPAITTYAPTSTDSFGGRKIIALYSNDDTNLDLIVGSGKGAWLYLGQEGGTFITPPTRLPGTEHLISDLFLADLDKDGNNDLVISCRDQDCLSVLARAANGTFPLALPFDAPSSKFIATGDLDGDGQPDLVGSGRILWTSLSGSAPTETSPLLPTGQRPRTNDVVINEILAINTGLPIRDRGDEEHSVDWVELYNGRGNAFNLVGWKLRVEDTIRTNEFILPPTFFLATNSTDLIFFSEANPRPTLYHTGFRLSGDGGTLTLLDGSGTVVDRVEYPPQRPNISYARYRDGLRAFVFNPFPSPRRSNPVNGTVEPTLKFGGVDPGTFQPASAMRLFADVADDVGVSSLIMHYARLDRDGLNLPPQPVQFFDDGQHGDLGVSDGCFGGDLVGSLPAGAEVQFYFQILDLNDQIIEVPDEWEFGTPDTPGNAYQLGIGFDAPLIEISEIVAANETGLTDANGGTPDWVEIRNVSSMPITLTNLSLSQQIGDNARYNFPAGYSLAPGEHFIVFCDNNPDQGTNHAPIGLNRSGETVMLTSLTTNNSRTLVDWVRFGPQEPDVAWARLGAGGAFRKTAPTPAAGNIAASWLGLVQTNGELLEFVFAFPTMANATYVIEHAPEIDPGSTWTTLHTVAGDGIEKVIRRPLEERGFFRVRRSP